MSPASCALPPLSIPDGWPEKPGIRLYTELADPFPEPTTAIEAAYCAALHNLAAGERMAALEHARDVVTQDVERRYSSARLLVLLLSASLGDVATVTSLVDSCITIAQPDVFAQRAVQSCDMDLFAHETSVDPSISLGECLDQSAVAAQLALAACLLAVGRKRDAVSELDMAMQVRVLRCEAWEVQRGVIDAEERELVSSVMRERLGDPGSAHWHAALRAAEIVPLEDFREYSEGNYAVKNAAELHAEARKRAKAPEDLRAPRSDAGPLSGLGHVVCQLRTELGEADRVIEYIESYTFPGWELWKASALEDKGLTDAALAVYDDCIRRGKREGIMLESIARYRKAALLISIGDMSRARRELGRLYADYPAYDDIAGLLDKVKVTTRSSSRELKREPVSEEVRHAVWRRDQGQCVGCGSQESLEFDHIIPFSRGGSNTERNLQLLCESCNRKKSATI